MHQNDATGAYGGPRVLLDGSSDRSLITLKTILFWVGLTLMMLGCIGSFCVSLYFQETLPSPPATATATRPRRLDIYQVQSMLPQHRVQPHDCISGSECSICLDEIQQEDWIRSLPCNHCYHSDCIAKWLIERHSTCPLCKLDLYPPSDDDNDESSEEPSVLEHTDTDGIALDTITPQESNVTTRRWIPRWFESNNHHNNNNDTSVDPTPLLETHSEA
jgi:Ring finger domain